MLYPNNFEQKIGFDEIRKLLRGHCISSLGAERVDHLEMMTRVEDIRQSLQQVQEMQLILDQEEQLPGEDFFDLRAAARRIRVEGMSLDEQEMWQLKRSLDTLHSWVSLIRQGDEEEHASYPALSHMSEGVFTFLQISKSIARILDQYGHIRDDASPEMARIRRELSRAEGSVSRALNAILTSAQEEGLVDRHVMPTMRDGRLVIPVSPAMKRRIRGIVHDESASGKTVFIEPSSVVEANNRIRELESEERREKLRILQEFTSTLRPNVPELLRAFEFLAELEYTLARVRLAENLGAICPQVQKGPYIDWAQARHPLLELSLRRQQKSVVPLDITLSAQKRILLISGPNAGGKSVCLKTVGLLQYMLQCGLPIPVAESSRTGVFQSLFIDIGDEQSIDDDLSTYSSHLLNMKHMMKGSNTQSLLLIDEFGGGTEPTIGGAMAQAMLQRFLSTGTYGIITTHYQNLKQYAEEHEGLVNGAMLYDRQQMQALFILQTGHAGSSFAIEIARKIGIPEDVIADATEIVGQDYVNADKYLLDIVRDKRYWENKRQTIHAQEKQMQQTLERYEKDIAELKSQRKEIIHAARQKADEIIQNSNAIIENTIREIREAQAEKERTREIRQELGDFRQQMQTPNASQDEHDRMIERKMQQIQDRKRRRDQRRQEKQAKQQESNSSVRAEHPKQSELSEGVIVVGSTVRIKGQTSVGTVEEINGKRASVLFGIMRTVVELGRLEYASPLPKEQPTADYSYISRQTQQQMHHTRVNFRQDIDVRGMRADEALDVIAHYIDDAILVGAAQVRILHGTGTGALRQIIRQYLNTVPQVRSAKDEHVQFGGAGITVVQFNG